MKPKPLDLDAKIKGELQRLQKWLASGRTRAERIASAIERAIPRDTQDPYAIKARDFAALARAAAAKGSERKAEALIFEAQAFALRFEARRGSKQGGVKAAGPKKTKAAEWQKKIEPRVKRLLAADRTDTNIAGLLYHDTATADRPARSLRTVRGYVASVRKDMKAK